MKSQPGEQAALASSGAVPAQALPPLFGTLDAVQRVLVVFAHPRFEKSRANRALLSCFPNDENIAFRDLYELYPDFNVDVGKEQDALASSDVVVLHHPLYWYSAPPLVKQWIDLVLAFGWAYGPGGTALHGKTLFHAFTTGGDAAAYARDGLHRFTLAEFLVPFQRTATLCGMRWLPPFVVHGTHRLSDTELTEAAQLYARTLLTFCDGTLDLEQASQHPTLNAAILAGTSR